MNNQLYYGDCLTIMEGMQLGSVDLIYLDPPFNSNRDYNAIYKDETGRPLPDQIEAFCDTWRLNVERQRSLREIPRLMRDTGIDDNAVEFWRMWMNALRKTNTPLLSYMVYMTERLLPMRGILKPTGSIYLHCDPTSSHYIKVMMDSIFGHKNFRNEVIWHYQTGGSSKKRYGKKHDVLLFYSKGSSYTFNHNDSRLQVSRGAGAIARAQNPKGARIASSDTTKTAMDVWCDIAALNPMAQERMGYATQKPVALLERIIAASSKKGDVIFDPFCGCATTIEAAHNLGRQWIGIDIAIHAIKRVASSRLRDRMGLVEDQDFVLKGIPRNLEGARDLWNRDKYHFQKWAVEQVDGFVTHRKTGDGGIDGRIYFTLADTDESLSSMVLEVKGGKNVGIETIRSLRGVLERDEAKMAGLIIMEPLGDRKKVNFRQEMASTGDLELNGCKYSKMQILTVDDILKGKRFNTPSRAMGRGEAQPVLPLG